MKQLTEYLKVAILFCFFIAFGSCKNENVSITNMRCEYLENPICIDAQNPRFTWTYLGESRFVQSKYQIEIADYEQYFEEKTHEGKGFNWNSGVIDSKEMFGTYSGTEKLKSQTKYYWRVTVWNKSGGYKIVSPVSGFETAKFDKDDWAGVWITDSFDKDSPKAPMLRKSFTVNGDIKDASLYISAAAYYKIEVNGQQVSSTCLNPGYTHYDKRNLYNVYDVSKYLTSGENVLSAVLGNGFYNEIEPVATWGFENARWRGRARMICELDIQYADGKKQVVGSDDTWKTNCGPYLQNNIYAGDTYDARLEINGWDKAGFDDSTWSNAIQTEPFSPILVSQKMPSIDVDQEIQAIAMKNFGDSVYVYDFGTNMSGYCRLSINGEKGTNVKLQYGELLKKDGRLETGNIDIYYKPVNGLEFQTDKYILNGEDAVFTPCFTYHGFRYVEIRADKPIKLQKENLVAEFVHTAVKPVGKFSCSNDTLNMIWKIVNQSYLSNLMSIPTDCPQREKNGWTADAHISVDLGLLNFDGINFYEKWMDDFIDNQTEEGSISGIIPSYGWGYADWIGPVWDAAMFIIPKAIYNYYGNTKCIEKIVPTCEKYLKYLASREDENGTVTYGIGDWVPYNTKTPTDYTTTCYYYLDNLYMSQFLNLLGKDGSAYEKKAQALKDFINTKYFDESKMLYSNGSQAAQGVALYLGLVPDNDEQKVADNLSKMIKENNNHLDFGMLGSKTVLRMLTKYGYVEQAYEMAMQQDAPSWANWIKLGYTTPIETWVMSPKFNDASTNHVFLGDINAWMYNVLAGINYDEQQPGFRNIIIKPYFIKNLDWVKAEYNSVSGMIRSEWERTNNKITLVVTIPVNTTATIDVAGKKMEVKSGTHKFTFKQQ